MISPEPGIYYDDSLTITISDATTGATIRYTTDGTTPSETNGIIYTAPVNISTTTTLQAIAYMSGFTDSAVASGVYTFGMGQIAESYMIAKEAWGITIPGWPTLTGFIDFWEASAGYNAYLVANGTWSSGSSTIFYLIRAHSADAAPSAATIISTGVAYTAGVTEYDGWPAEPLWLSTAIPITTSVDIFMVNRCTGYIDSDVSQATFLVDTTHACEVLYIPLPGPYIGIIQVGLYSNTDGSSIRYTTDGETAPTESVGTLYTGLLTISTTTTIKAIAYKTGLSDSPETDGTYTITAGSRAFIFG
jgi:hypothetical protein